MRHQKTPTKVSPNTSLTAAPIESTIVYEEAADDALEPIIMEICPQPGDPFLNQLEISDHDVIIESDQWDNFTDIIICEEGGVEEVTVESTPIETIQMLEAPVAPPPRRVGPPIRLNVPVAVPLRPAPTRRASKPPPSSPASKPASAVPARLLPRPRPPVPPPTRVTVPPIPKDMPIGPPSLVRMMTTSSEEEQELEEVMQAMELFVCQVCGDNSGTFFDLRRHVLLKHRGEKYEICCNLSINSLPAALYDHIRWHLDRTRFACHETLCKFRGTSSADLADHAKRKHKPKKFQCKFCCEKFRDNLTYWHHIKEFHRQNLKMVCEECGMEFTCPDMHYKHTMEHIAAKEAEEAVEEDSDT